MPRVGLATWATRVPLPDQEDALLAGALREMDVDVRRIIWDRDPLDCDLCVIRTTWDYFERRDEFLDWVARAARRCPLWNPPELVRWNLHKGYLRELEAARSPCRRRFSSTIATSSRSYASAAGSA